MALISSENNIKLAYRTIKGNKGSHTPGVDKRTIKNLASMSEEKFVRLIQKQFSWYKPRPVRRVEIPKPNGKTRPLGIPTIIDRIVQQCILQVLEPICEAKFSEHSNDFRPNRSTETAIAECCRLMQVQHLYYAVDIDIQGFFDNVHHGKLIRQMWEMGIRDKKLLCIIKQMLKAPVVLPDGKKLYPTKGTPQGGILSPLLSNIVLNELDWWVSSQWENMPTHYDYKTRQNASGTTIKSHIFRALRGSNLIEAVKTAQKDHDDLKAETIKVIRGESKLDAELLTTLVHESKEKLASAQAIYDKANEELNALIAGAQNLRDEYHRILSWADLYEKRSSDAKKMIVCQFIKAVHVGRGYQLSVDLNVSFEALRSISMQEPVPTVLPAAV